ncbi:MAG: hypothetical protein ACKOQR_15245 [Dolichospermum sp.]
MQYNFTTSHGEATVTSKKFPELMELIVSAECWDIDSSDLPVITMGGTATLLDGRKISLRGTRDVGIRTGSPPRLIIKESTTPALKLEYLTISGGNLPKLPYKSAWSHWWHDGREITENEAIKIVSNIAVPKNHRIHLDYFGYNWQRKSIVSYQTGLNIPVWVR